MTRKTVGNRRRAGAALLIVLVLVTIASILLVAYLGMVKSERTTTQNYSGELSADQVALGGLDRFVGDLDQEIAAGSTAIPGPTATSPTYYQPTNALTMVPARYNDTDWTYTNVVRVSSSNTNYYQAAYPASNYPGQVPVNLAVASSTTNMSPDGRYLSAARWQAPQLLLPSETNVGIMPVPDWILMTRSGPTNATGLTFGGTGNTLNNRAASNPNYVVGRYAYIVYNEGGLLDATVAGAPSSGAGAPSADDVGNRGSLALALLTNNFLTPSQMTNLASWRNAATDTSESIYTNYVYTTGATNGFLQVQPGDNTFFSRQDLIAYANYTNIASALPYLGTFNRSINAPAYTPATTNTINPDLLTLRFANGGTINSGGTLLQPRSVQVGDFLLTRRFPLSRLSWIGYNGLANGASAYDVWRAFGLVYDNINNVWVYVSAAGSAMPTTQPPVPATNIETLAQVASGTYTGDTTPRDPDFFELLQAGILKGSLGQTAGPQYTFSGSSVYLFGGSGDTSGYDSVQAYQIMQIGVNIIDQARADSFPTPIRFGPDPRDSFVKDTTGAPDDLYTSPRTFYGVKNLPYISRIVDTYARWITPPSPLSNSDKLANGVFSGQVYRQPYVGCWQQIELWNPHQTNAATPVPTSSLYPFALRVAASGTIHGEVYSRQTTSSGEYIAETYKIGNRITAGPGETTWAFTANYIQLSSSASTNFWEPKMIFTTDTTSSAANCVQPSTLTTGSGANGVGGIAFTGLYVGSAYAPDWEYCATNSGARYPTTPVTAGSATYDPACMSYNDARIDPFVTNTSPNPGTIYEMQYQDTNNGTWRPYGVVKNQSLTADTVMPISTTNASSWTIINSDAKARFSQGIDPRTDRFSMSESRGSDNGISGADPNLVDTPPNADSTIRPLLPATGYSSDGCIPYSNASGTTWLGNSIASTPVTPPTVPQPFYYLGGIMENTTNSSVYYQDPDGVLRRGDSAYDSAASNDGHPGIGSQNFTDDINLARPVFLNRPFRSVGELGYVGRDLPWKTLDFFTKDSGDAGLLDLFSASDASVVAGTIDLNTRNAQALAEVIGGSAINPNYAAATDSLASPITSGQATTLANALIAATTTLPLRSRAEMVTTALDPNTGETALATDGYTAQSSKIQREAAIRALSEVGNARTWNLLVDIIAQSGRYPQTLAPNSSFDNFIPDGEKRYWLHIAIDRYTGRVVDRFLEPVQE